MNPSVPLPLLPILSFQILEEDAGPLCHRCLQSEKNTTFRILYFILKGGLTYWAKELQNKSQWNNWL